MCDLFRLMPGTLKVLPKNHFHRIADHNIRLCKLVVVIDYDPVLLILRGTRNLNVPKTLYQSRCLNEEISRNFSLIQVIIVENKLLRTRNKTRVRNNSFSINEENYRLKENYLFSLMLTCSFSDHVVHLRFYSVYDIVLIFVRVLRRK